MTLRGADLIAFYLSADRLPVQRQWSRKHAHTQRRLCERFAIPVIGAVLCQDITTRHMQQIVNAAPTPGEGDRVRGMISALVTAGLQGGYLASGRLAQVHWQAGDRALPPPRASAAGESALWIDPAEVPADTDVAALGQALATGLHGDRDELMAVTAAYSGLRWGELAALTIGQVDPAGRVIAVDRKVVEVAGHLYVAAHPLATRWPSGSPPALSRPALSRPLAPIPSGWSSPPRQASTGGPPTSTATSCSAPIARPAGVIATATAGGPGIACGTCSAPRPCSPGSLRPPTCPGWLAIPATASLWTCTSAPPPASWTAPARPPNEYVAPVPVSVSNDGCEDPEIEALVRDIDRAMAGHRGRGIYIPDGYVGPRSRITTARCRQRHPTEIPQIRISGGGPTENPRTKRHSPAHSGTPARMGS
jgi:hypothetical protein